ncbi:DNA cytosine methyltransferase [Altererythrobacter sp. C41]|uniref:DNA cytosine methyltransferase n=1 Tax=Altererythrobacter sp. C41 TaxID=2806021 RepID=UPI00193430B6|nr:DNA cytosine methyltransferase [Altererythrobacter sp. C41]MBM0169166.1 DNA cytosine methyltransferase [Altererythrobacter sp. C41]
MKKFSKRQAPLNVVSLYTGAGGLDLGFEAAGFITCAAVELDANARMTLEDNRPQWVQPENGNALEIDPDALLTTAGLQRQQVDALIGGPPCQPFSKSAFWAAGTTRRLDDPRARTLGAMLDLAEAILPRVLVIENVRGIAYREKDEAMTLVQQRLGQINERHGTRYTSTVTYLQATDFGVPQMRERAFLVSFRDGQTFEAPEAITGVSTNHTAPTAWDAIGDLVLDDAQVERLAARGKWAGLLPSVPEGQNYLWHTDRGGGLPLFGWRTRYWSFLLKLAKDRPAWTIQADPGPATGPFHWDSRLLSIEEMARLQSFPIGYRFAGDYRAARRQIGNAVPPALAEAVARRISSILLHQTYRSSLTLAVPSRGTPPAPAEVKQVADQFRILAGHHEAHPGTGKGPAALLRPAPLASLPQGGSEHFDADPIDDSGEEPAAA